MKPEKSWRTPPESDPLEGWDSLSTLRTANVCETDGRNGLPTECLLLSSALLLFDQFMVKIAATGFATDRPIRGRLAVGCQVCRRRRNLSVRFESYATVPLLLRSLGLLEAADTSITWQMDLRAIGMKNDTVFGKWQAGNTNGTILAGMLLGSSKSSAVESIIRGFTPTRKLLNTYSRTSKTKKRGFGSDE